MKAILARYELIVRVVVEDDEDDASIHKACEPKLSAMIADFDLPLNCINIEEDTECPAESIQP